MVLTSISIIFFLNVRRATLDCLCGCIPWYHFDKFIWIIHHGRVDDVVCVDLLFWWWSLALCVKIDGGMRCSLLWPWRFDVYEGMRTSPLADWVRSNLLSGTHEVFCWGVKSCVANMCYPLLLMMRCQVKPAIAGAMHNVSLSGIKSCRLMLDRKSCAIVDGGMEL
jgi:hypothetical protein